MINILNLKAMAKYYIKKKTEILKRNILGEPLEVLDKYYIYRRRWWFKKEYLDLNLNYLYGNTVNTPWGYDDLMKRYQEKIKEIDEELRYQFNGCIPFKEYPISWKSNTKYCRLLTKDQAEYVLEDIVSNPNYYIDYE